MQLVGSFQLLIPLVSTSAFVLTSCSRTWVALAHDTALQKSILSREDSWKGKCLLRNSLLDRALLALHLGLKVPLLLLIFLLITLHKCQPPISSYPPNFITSSTSQRTHWTHPLRSKCFFSIMHHANIFQSIYHISSQWKCKSVCVSPHTGVYVCGIQYVCMSVCLSLPLHYSFMHTYIVLRSENKIKSKFH